MRGCTVQGNLQQVYEVTNLNHHVFKEVRIKIKIKLLLHIKSHHLAPPLIIYKKNQLKYAL